MNAIIGKVVGKIAEETAKEFFKYVVASGVMVVSMKFADRLGDKLTNKIFGDETDMDAEGVSDPIRGLSPPMIFGLGEELEQPSGVTVNVNVNSNNSDVMNESNHTETVYEECTEEE